MDTVMFFDALADYIKDQTEEMILPTKREKGETEAEYRSANVYEFSLPNTRTAVKFAPYILLKKVTGSDVIKHGGHNRSFVTVRAIFCVFNEDPQEGSKMLINLMERLRIALLKWPIVDKRFTLYLPDEDGKIETVIYQEDIQPYYAGEMVTTWQIPSIQEEPPDLNWGKDYVINVGKTE